MNTEQQRKQYFESLFVNKSVNKNSRLKTFIHLYKGNFSRIIYSLFFYIIKNSPVWILPLVTSNIINIVSKPDENNLNLLWWNLIVIIIVLAQNIPFNALYHKYLSIAIRQVEASLRSSLVRKLQQLSISYHRELKAGKLQSKVLRDVEAIEFLSRQTMASLIPAIINIVVAVIIIVTRSYIVTLFFLGVIPVSSFLIILFRKNIRQTNNEFRREIEDMSAKVSEMVQMIPITRAHALENVEIKKIDNQLEKVKSKGFKLDMITAYFGSYSWVTFQVFSAICLIFTGYLAYIGKIPVGDVILYQGFFNTIVNQIASITNIYPQIAKGFESIDSVTEILLADEIEKNQSKRKVKNVIGNFKFENVSFNYNINEEPVIKDIDLNVKEGECIAFVGESGAGKSTILNLIIGYSHPTKGKILLDGEDMKNIDLRSYRKFLSVVPQNNILFSGTIKDNIMYGVYNITNEQIEKVVELANLREFINSLPEGLETRVGEHGGKLSGGQRQRIAIARAMIRNPKIIVLDEATSALDTISEYHVQQAMNHLIKGKTTFIVAHRLSTIRDADRIVVMKKGRCVEVGTYEELTKLKGEFYNMRQLQS
ncbi:MAG: ABC transporter ATP-binding protein [Eubacteriales bacterium]